MPIADLYAFLQTTHPVGIQANNSSWQFYFKNSEGRTVLDNWLHESRTNPAMRKALRLPN